MDVRQSPNYARYMKSLGWLVENGAFIKKLWFTSIVKIQHPAKINLDFLKKYHPFLIKIEPGLNSKFEILNSEFRRDNWPLSPSKTLILDLKNFSPAKDIRYEIRKAQKNNLTVNKLNDPEVFYKMLQETMKIGGWSIPIKKEVINLWRSFQPNNSIILSTKYSACLLIWHGNTAHYMYAALTKDGRKTGAAYLTLWEAIKFCQKKGLKYLDLEGLYDQRYPASTKNWQGFTAFKLQWGEKVVEYPGSYSKFLWPK